MGKQGRRAGLAGVLAGGVGFVSCVLLCAFQRRVTPGGAILTGFLMQEFRSAHPPDACPRSQSYALLLQDGH